jgi:hypothetical protein
MASPRTVEAKSDADFETACRVSSSYYPNPLPDATYMELRLDGDAPSGA